MKKLTATALALALMLQTAAFADALFSDIKGTEYYAKPIETLAEYNIASGYTDGTYHPEKIVSRAEMASFICRVIGKADEVNALFGTTVFSDVAPDNWASGYIAYASQKGIIDGDPDGRFRPEDKVKVKEAVKMTVCAFGLANDITPDSEDWSRPYLKIAEEKGITDNIWGKYDANLIRGDAAVILYNAMQSTTAQMSGKGLLYIPSGGIYEGDIVNGKANGKGRVIYPEGDIFEGEVADNVLQGQGQVTFPDGTVYIGSFENDDFSGEGKYIFYNGDIFEGTFENGMRSGKGVYKWVTGEIYEGDYKDDMQTGIAKITWSDGTVYEGEVVNGERNGKGKLIFSNGTVYEGDFLNGNRTGFGKYTWPNGDTFEGEFKENKRGEGVYKNAKGEIIAPIADE